MKIKYDILSGQKIIKNAKNSQFWLAVKQCYQTGQYMSSNDEHNA